MQRWNSEEEARNEIKELVSEYYTSYKIKKAVN